MAERARAETVSACFRAALAAAPGTRFLAMEQGTLSYAQAADYLDKEAHPERYHPLNLLDARDATVWCSAGGDSPAACPSPRGPAWAGA